MMCAELIKEIRFHQCWGEDPPPGSPGTWAGQPTTAALFPVSSPCPSVCPHGARELRRLIFLLTGAVHRRP